jgi:glycerophosphoryl diester phosphodiesterase
MATNAPGAPPLVIAHRGASGGAPEHTIAAYELAVTEGADSLALRVHLSRDDHLVVIHDASLERTTNGAGPVRQRSVRELKRLDAGGWYEARFAGQRIQTLHEVLERFRGRARFLIDVPAGSDVYPGIEDRLVGAIEVYDVVERSVLQSRDPAALGRLHGFNRMLSLATVVDRPPIDTAALAGGPVRAISAAVELLTDLEVDRIRKAGLDCYGFTANEPAQMDRLVSWGVTGIVTDRPALLRARLRR